MIFLAVFVLSISIAATLIYAVPAAWIARHVASVSESRVLLAHARGLWHDGSALLVLTSGAGGADATHWQQRVGWTVSLQSPWRLNVRVTWPEAGPPLQATLSFGFSGWTLDAAPWRGAVPLAALRGLGAPFNTLALEGNAQVSFGTLKFSPAGAMPPNQPNVEIAITQLRSALAQGVALGDYNVRGHARTGGGTFELSTRQGVLLLEGRGQCMSNASKSRLFCGFNGTARAARHDDALLGNLLGLLGKSQPQAALGSTLNGTTPVTELRW